MRKVLTVRLLVSNINSMKKVIKLTESDLTNIVTRVIKENEMMDVSSDSDYYKSRRRDVTIPFNELAMLGQFATNYCEGKGGSPDPCPWTGRSGTEQGTGPSETTPYCRRRIRNLRPVSGVAPVAQPPRDPDRGRHAARRPRKHHRLRGGWPSKKTAPTMWVASASRVRTKPSNTLCWT